MGGAISGIGQLVSGTPGGQEMRQAGQIQQDIFNYIQNIRLPTLEELQIKPEDIQYYQVTGKFTPEMYKAIQMDKTLLEDLQANPQYVKDQLAVVEAKKQRLAEGGLSAEDRARLNEVTQELARQNLAQQQTIGARLRERGAAGTPVEALMRLRGQAQAADTAADIGFKTAALAATSKLQEEQNLSDMLGRLSAQDVGLKEARARAEAERQKYNIGLLNEQMQRNIQLKNLAQEKALADQQRAADLNTQLANQRMQQNLAARQQALQNEMLKAQAMRSGGEQYSGYLRDEAARKQAEQAGKWAAIGGIADAGIKTGAGLYTGGFSGLMENLAGFSAPKKEALKSTVADTVLDRKYRDTDQA
jgi:hypothetical protein